MYRDESEQKIHCDVAKCIAVLSYLFFIGWVIALVLYGNHRDPYVRYHLRQSLGLLIGLVLFAIIPLIGWLLCVFTLALWFIGIYYALSGQKRSVPVVGDFFQQHLSFIL